MFRVSGGIGCVFRGLGRSACRSRRLVFAKIYPRGGAQAGRRDTRRSVHPRSGLPTAPGISPGAVDTGTGSAGMTPRDLRIRQYRFSATAISTRPTTLRTFIFSMIRTRSDSTVLTLTPSSRAMISLETPWTTHSNTSCS